MSALKTALLISVVAAVIAGLHAENEIHLFRDRRDAGDVNCKSKNFENPSKKCCKNSVDSFFSTSLAKSCDTINVTENVPSYLTTYKLNQFQDFNQSNAIILTSEAAIETFGPASCLVECVFRDQNLIFKNGTINFDAVGKYFTDKASKPWQQIVPEVVKNCSTIVQGSTVTTITVPIKPPPIKPPVTCLIQPALLVQCVILNLLENCSPEKNPPKYCGTWKSNLEKCDPFKHA